MIDYPSGEWSEILVGFYWPMGSNVATINSESISFEHIAAGYRAFEDQLCEARSGSVNRQEGITAHDLREAFQRGQKQAHEIVEKNEIKKFAYHSVNDSLVELRSELTTIAENGNSKIKQIQDSKDSFPIKTDKIIEIIINYQDQAKLTAIKYCDNILSATQRILNREGVSISARQFAKDYGIETEHLSPSLNRDEIRSKVTALLDNPDLSASPGASADLSPTGGGLAPSLTPIIPAPSGAEILKPSTSGPNPPRTPILVAPAGAENLKPSLVQPAPTIPASGTSPAPIAGTPTPQIPAPGLSPLAAPTTTSPAAPPPGLTPSGLMQSFDRGIQTSAPISEAANALSNTQMNPVESPPPVTAEAPVRAITSTSAHPPVFDLPQTTHLPATPPSINASLNDTTTYLPAPAGTAPPVLATPPPAGPLQTYGSDLRPATPLASAPATPSGPPPAAPASAPVSPSSATSGVGQPAVVRQPVTPAIAPQTSIVERAMAASAAGAAAGTASEKTTAQNRLQHLVDTVAHQEPRLRWAAGDRPDGTTVLVTDLASGWIPPDIGIPVGLQLRHPAYRRGDIEALLGEVTLTASYTPTHYIPSPGNVAPLAVSSRARQLTTTEDLGWELSQATKWRDGLPQLAHTLAKAAAKGTGVLDSEIEFLRQERAKAREQVLNSYPHGVDAAAVSNWQLLAAINALAENDKMGAQYHFAWFKAVSQTKMGGGMP